MSKDVLFVLLTLVGVIRRIALNDKAKMKDYFSESWLEKISFFF
jgi:hypothetical protein